MSNRKNYNSLVFLTTLSVYLGLVLVGGSTPSVLAQAATTRDFDIKNEIVVEDDLDKKPDAEEEIKSLAESLNKYFDEVEYFVQDLQKLHSIEKFDFGYSSFQFNRNRFSLCDTSGKPLGIAQYETDDSRILSSWVIAATTDAVYKFEDWNNFSDCLPNSKVVKSNAKAIGTKVSYDKAGGLKVELVIDKASKQSAEKLAGDLNRAFKLYEVAETNSAIIKEIIPNTSFKSENNQVFIVTRLPRASIDALLAEK